MTYNSPIVTQSTIVEIPIVTEILDLIVKISERPVAIGVFALLGILSYFAFKKP